MNRCDERFESSHQDGATFMDVCQLSHLLDITPAAYKSDQNDGRALDSMYCGGDTILVMQKATKNPQQKQKTARITTRTLSQKSNQSCAIPKMWKMVRVDHYGPCKAQS